MLIKFDTGRVSKSQTTSRIVEDLNASSRSMSMQDGSDAYCLAGALVPTGFSLGGPLIARHGASVLTPRSCKLDHVLGTHDALTANERTWPAS